MKQLRSTTGTIVLVAFVELSLTLPAAGGWQDPGAGIRGRLRCLGSQSCLIARVLGCTLTSSNLNWHRCVVAPLWSMRTRPWL